MLIAAHDETVFPVRPRRTADIGELAEVVVRHFQPMVYEGGQAVDILSLMEDLEPDVYTGPAHAKDMPGEEGKTIVSLQGPIEVLIRADQWDAVCSRGGLWYTHGRATMAHECGHVYLHVAEYRRRAMTLSRSSPIRRAEIEAFRDPEWQAWTFGAALLMPPTIVRSMVERSPAALAERFEVSPKFAEVMLRRFKIAG